MPVAFTQQQATSTSDLGAQIREQVQQTVQQQVQAAQEQARQAREQAQLAREQARQAQEATRSFTIQPPFPPGFPGGPSNNVVTLGIAFFVMVAVIIIGLPIARAIGRYLDRRSHSPTLNPDLSAQLTRIEQGVDAMAIEVERISEAQRYMARLETERRGEAAVLRPGEKVGQ